MKFDCSYCHTRLVPIGSKRKNGDPSITDRYSRLYHRRCYKLKTKENPTNCYTDRDLYTKREPLINSSSQSIL